MPDSVLPQDTAPVDRLLDEALSHYRARRYVEAEALAREALALQPRDARIWNMLGISLRRRGRSEEAIACYREALEIAPTSPGPWSNLGHALKDLKLIDSAIACHRHALTLVLSDASHHHDLGVALTAAGRHGEALQEFHQAVALSPDNPRLRWDRGLAYLHLGDFARGWADYESRLVTGHLTKRDLPGRRWRGDACQGQTLLIVSEQGFGDTIWAARYLARVKATGCTLILECHAELIPLIAPLGLVDRVVPLGGPLPAADWHIHICSLPGLFTPAQHMIPSAPYLATPPDRAGKFASVMSEAGGRLKIGIVWSGSTAFSANGDRAVGLDRFLRAFSLPGIQLYSLQKGAPASELKSHPAARVIDLDPLIADFADTAAVLEQLDLVIMTDSAVAHLGGALGRPVWVLLNFVSYWLWQSAPDCPWYPSLRLFRPQRWNDWDGVFDTAAAALLPMITRRKV